MNRVEYHSCASVQDIISEYITHVITLEFGQEMELVFSSWLLVRDEASILSLKGVILPGGLKDLLVSM